MVILFLHSLFFLSLFKSYAYVHIFWAIYSIYAEEHYQTGEMARIGMIYICPISINKSVGCAQESSKAAGAFH